MGGQSLEGGPGTRGGGQGGRRGTRLGGFWESRKMSWIWGGGKRVSGNGGLWDRGVWEWGLWKWMGVSGDRGVFGNGIYGDRGVSGNGISGNGVFLGMQSPGTSPVMAPMDPPDLACRIPFPVPPAPSPAPAPLPAPLTLPEAGVNGVGGLGPTGRGPAAQLDQLVQPQLAAVNGGGLGLQRNQQLLRRLRGHQPGLRGHAVTRWGGDGGGGPSSPGCSHGSGVVE